MINNLRSFFHNKKYFYFFLGILSFFRAHLWKKNPKKHSKHMHEFWNLIFHIMYFKSVPSIILKIHNFLTGWYNINWVYKFWYTVQIATCLFYSKLMNTMWIISEFRNGKQSKLTNYLIAGVIMTIEEITNYNTLWTQKIWFTKAVFTFRSPF